MPFTVYKTTNTVSGEFYIGVHKTDTPSDDYLGSGLRLRRALLKYGKSNFVKVILYTCDTSDEAYQMEYALLGEHLPSPLCYNIIPGGHGGFEYINKSGLNGAKSGGYKEATKKRIQLEIEDPVFAAKQRSTRLQNATKARLRLAYLEGNKKSVEVWTGKTHSSEAKQRMSDAKKGDKNNMFGSCWITRPSTGENKKIPKGDLPQWIKEGWAPGRNLPKK